MLGLPYETKENIIETIKMNIKCGVKSQSVGIFYPYKGTSLRELCIKEGFFDLNELEKRELEISNSILTRTNSILKMPQLSHSDLMWYRNNFILYTEMPDWLWEILDKCKDDKIIADKLIPVLKECVYKKRFETSLIQ